MKQIPSETGGTIQLIHWIQASNVKLQKHNVRPYGPYELLVSFDGANFAAFPYVYGWGRTLEEAFADCLTKEFNTGKFSQELAQWMGSERTEQLTVILLEQQNESTHM